jgi:glycosyltransferase involved in cell wall biosynthesis
MAPAAQAGTAPPRLVAPRRAAAVAEGATPRRSVIRRAPQQPWPQVMCYGPAAMDQGASGAGAPADGNRPALSIGLIVYNGVRHVERALDTLLAQEFRDFELIISDDASTDETPAICARYAARDPRIRLVRSSVNRGAAWNFNHVAELARGELFVWAAQDDEWHPQFLARCVSVLRSQPDVVCCYCIMQPIDEEGVPFGRLISAGCDGATTGERWNNVLRNWETNALIYGVTRTAAFRRTRGMGAFMASDYVFVTELMLHGKAAIVPEPLHFKRGDRKGWKSISQMLRQLGTSPQRRPWMRFFVRFQVLRQMLEGLRHANLPASEERALARDARWHFWRSRSWRHDLVDAAWEVLGPDRTDRIRRRLGRPARA